MLRQLANTHVPRGAVTPGETFIPFSGVGMSTEAFGPGDTTGDERRALAVADAKRQGALFDPESPRGKLFALQEALGQLKPIDLPLQHLFPPGLYMRTIRLPAGSVLVGKIHKHRHGNILSAGRVRVFTEFGGTEEFEGPLQMISEPGTKRAVLALTDAVWTTLHLNPDNTQDLAVLEARIIASTYEEYDAFVRGEQ